MDKCLTGYHYTSLSNWLRIKELGLIPYLIQKPTLDPYYPGGVMGIWIWVDKFKGLPHAGSILYQMTMKGETSAAWLEVKYDYTNILRWNGRKIELSHDGNMEKLVYHTGAEKSVLVTTPIPPEDIKLLKIYDLLKALK